MVKNRQPRNYKSIWRNCDMGKIINILGPHGVGKTTLQNYIRDHDLGIVAEGFILPVGEFNLSDPDDYLRYEEKYLVQINRQNQIIKNSLMNGYVIRSIEEIEYFLRTYSPKIDVRKIREIINDDSNILCDMIIYLDSSKRVLEKRIADDLIRDQVETTKWYASDFKKYDRYWKNYNKTNIIDTSELSVAEVFEKIKEML